MNHTAIIDYMMIDLWTFQYWHDVRDMILNDGMYTADASMSPFIGDDKHMMNGSGNVDADDNKSVRRMFKPAYEWLMNMMHSHGINPMNAIKRHSDALSNEIRTIYHDGTGIPLEQSLNDSMNTMCSSCSFNDDYWTEPAVSGSITPLWFYAKWSDFDKTTGEPCTVHSMDTGKPDRRLMEFRNFKDYDLIHARIDDSRILLTDFDAWNGMLNHSAIPDYTESGQWTDRQWDEWFDRMDELTMVEIMDSWEHCLCDANDLTSLDSPAFIQGTCWELMRKDIITVNDRKPDYE